MLRKLTIAAGAILAAACLSAGPAFAAPAHTSTEASAPAPCAAGWARIFLTNADNLNLAVDGADAPLDLSTDTDNCWKGPGNGNTGYVKNIDGYCASYDATDNTFNAVSPCGNVSWNMFDQESSSGGYWLCNIYAENHGTGACYMAAASLNAGSTLTISGGINDRDIFSS